MHGYRRSIQQGSVSQGNVSAPVTQPLCTAQTPPQFIMYGQSGQLSGQYPTPMQFGDSAALERQQFWRANAHVRSLTAMDASQRIAQHKQAAVGMFSYKIGMPLEAQLSTKAPNINDANTARRRARAGGMGAIRKTGRN